MLVDWLKLGLGGAVLYLGAEWLVKGAAGLAQALGLRPLVVGLTIVAYGTSAPELAVSVAAALEGSSAIALGNVVGSNIANLGLILGVTALISPPRVEGGLIRREIPFLVGTTLVIPVLLLNGTIGRLEGAAMVALSVVYTAWMLRSAPPEEAAAVAEEAAAAAEEMQRDAEQTGAPTEQSRGGLAVIAAVGLALLIGGGKLLVNGAVGVARAAGVSEHVIGVTVVAVGTSLPELAASLVAAIRGQSAIAVGNIIGSNIFNVLLILGAAALVSPVSGELEAMKVDLVALGALTLLAAVSLRTARVLTRLEGIVLLLGYIAFLMALVVAR